MAIKHLPTRGLLVSDADESPEFLCACAAQSVNDAIVLVEGTEPGPLVQPLLREALTGLIEFAVVERANLRAGQKMRDVQTVLPNALSSGAFENIAVLAEHDLCFPGELERPPHPGLAQMLDSDSAIDPNYRLAIHHMLQAMIYLDRSDDADSVPHLQLAIDMAVESQTPAGGDRPRSTKPN